MRELLKSLGAKVYLNLCGKLLFRRVKTHCYHKVILTFLLFKYSNWLIM